MAEWEMSTASITRPSGGVQMVVQYEDPLVIDHQIRSAEPRFGVDLNQNLSLDAVDLDE